MNKDTLKAMNGLDEYWSILNYRWRTVLLAWIVLAAVLCTGVYLIPNAYKASTTIIDYPRTVPERYVAATVTDDPAGRLSMLQQEILSSTRLLQVIHKFNLYPRIVAAHGHDVAINELRKEIKIETNHGTSNGPSAFTLTFTNGDPKTAAAVANELANSFIVANLASREQQVRGTVSFIKDELNQAGSDLQAQEDQLRVFRMSHLGEMPDQASTNLQAISQLQVQLMAISDRLSRLAQQKLLIQDASEADPALRAANVATPASLLNAQLTQEKTRLADLLTRLTPQHPDVLQSEAKIKGLTAQLAKLPKVPAAVTRGADAQMVVIDHESKHLLSEQGALRRRLNQYQAKVDAVPVRQEQISDLLRNYDSAREHYRSLLDKYYSAEMASALEEKQDADRFEVLDRAFPPEHASFPNRQLLGAASVVAALIGAFLLGLTLERMDGSVKSEIDLVKMLSKDLELAGSIGTIAPALTVRRRLMYEQE